MFALREDGSTIWKRLTGIVASKLPSIKNTMAVVSTQYHCCEGGSDSECTTLSGSRERQLLHSIANRLGASERYDVSCRPRRRVQLGHVSRTPTSVPILYSKPGEGENWCKKTQGSRVDALERATG